MCKVSLKLSNEADVTIRLRAIDRTFFSSHQDISIALCMALSVRASVVHCEAKNNSTQQMNAVYTIWTKFCIEIVFDLSNMHGKAF